MCLKEIGLSVQNTLTILRSIVNMIGETYTVFSRLSTHFELEPLVRT